METVSSGTKEVEDRFPQLSFLLQLLNDEPWTFCEDRKNGVQKGEFLHRPCDLKEEITSVFSKVNLEKVEALYLYGAGLGHYAFPLLSWLKEDPKRDLIFLEDDIEVMRLFFESKEASRLLSHTQIHFRFLLEKKEWKAFLEERANEFPYEHIELIALESYKKKNPKRVSKMRLHLMRRTTVHHAIHIDESYHHVLSRNVFANFPRASSGFYANLLRDTFNGTPAIICGAGPSLSSEMETLKTLEDQALIFAGGSAIAGLSHKGILPHLGVAIDPNFEEYHRFKSSSAFEVPLLYTNRLHPRVFETCNGPHGYIRAMTGGPVEKWWEEELGIKPLSLSEGFDLEALSVTTTCLELAVMMGCNPIILAGVDLAFTGEKTYAAGIVNQAEVCFKQRDRDMRVSERLLKRKDRNGNPVYTLVKWVMESEAISRFAKKNKKTTFLSSTSGGIGFPGIPYRSLAELSFPAPFDLRGKVHQLIEKSRFSFGSNDCLKRLEGSFQKGKALAEEALCELKRIRELKGDPENGRMVLYQMELEELEAYSCSLAEVALSFEKTFNRSNRLSTWNASSSEKNSLKWKWLHSKWNGFNDLITYYLDSCFTK